MTKVPRLGFDLTPYLTSPQLRNVCPGEKQQRTFRSADGIYTFFLQNARILVHSTPKGIPSAREVVGCVGKTWPRPFPN